MRGQIDLAERSFADQAANGIVADRMKVFGVELAVLRVNSEQRFAEGSCELTREVLGMSLRAVSRASGQPNIVDPP